MKRIFLIPKNSTKHWIISYQAASAETQRAVIDVTWVHTIPTPKLRLYYFKNGNRKTFLFFSFLPKRWLVMQTTAGDIKCSNQFNKSKHGLPITVTDIVKLNRKRKKELF